MEQHAKQPIINSAMLMQLVNGDIFVQPSAESPQQTVSQTQHTSYYVWSPAEEQRLMSAIERTGKNWKNVQEAFFPQLKPMQIKNKYYALRRQYAHAESMSDRYSTIEDTISEFDRVRSQSVANIDQMLDALKEILNQSEQPDGAAQDPAQ